MALKKTSRRLARTRSLQFEYLEKREVLSVIGSFSNGKWTLDTDESHGWSASDTVATFGRKGDIPVTGDWSGDGQDKIGVFRFGSWFLDTDGDFRWDATKDTAYRFGAAKAIPVVGDWDGDGIAQIGAFYNSEWRLDGNSNGAWDGVDGGDLLIRFGLLGDTPVVGDWNGDGIDDVGVYLKTRGWKLDSNGNRRSDGVEGGDVQFRFSKGLPVVGDWGGTGLDSVGQVQGTAWNIDLDGNRQFNVASGDSTWTFTSTSRPIVLDRDEPDLSNHAPVLASIGNQSGQEGSLLTFTAQAIDADGDTLTFALDSGAPAGASIDPSTGVFTWIPSESQGGSTYSITVRVSDSGVPSLSDIETITVTPTEVNVAPILAAIGNKSVVEGNLLSFTANASDADLPTNGLTFSLSGAPNGASIDATTGLFTWTPSEGPGIYNITVQVTDNGSPNLSDAETITVTVGAPPPNHAPVLDAIGNQSVNELSTLIIGALATDEDGDTLTFSLGSGAPSGASINPSTGTFSWTPSEAQGPGTFSITIWVTDDGSPNLGDSETFTVTVGEVNVAPVLDFIGDKEVIVGMELLFSASASDADLPNNGLSFSLDAGAPDGATIDSVSGAFSWTPSGSQGPGTYSVTIRVTDDGTPALSDFETIIITVS
jgi:hypothetical protein